ncbi:hypothetical protein ABZP36_027893 [Zizania latifolia]
MLYLYDQTSEMQFVWCSALSAEPPSRERAEGLVLRPSGRCGSVWAPRAPRSRSAPFVPVSPCYGGGGRLAPWRGAVEGILFWTRREITKKVGRWPIPRGGLWDLLASPAWRLENLAVSASWTRGAAVGFGRVARLAAGLWAAGLR